MEGGRGIECDQSRSRETSADGRAARSDEHEVLSHSFPAAPESVPRARALVATYAARAGAEGSRLDAVKLAVSEAATNVVVHAYREGRRADPS